MKKREGVIAEPPNANAVLNKLRRCKTVIGESKNPGSKNAGIENMNICTDFVVARNDLQQCKIHRDAAARRRRPAR